MTKGVEVRHGKTGSSIRVRFFYRGKEYREPLRLEPTKSNLAYAERLRGEILNAIERGTFDYRKAFPHGKNAAAFGQPTGAETIAGRLNEYILSPRPQALPRTPLLSWGVFVAGRANHCASLLAVAARVAHIPPKFC